ncbi:MAG TPA: peptidylprolyl isomerase [Anaerolineales bacterium]|nr:peptidylprolyl isomerase [Anaerolineales bacterium]
MDSRPPRIWIGLTLTLALGLSSCSSLFGTKPTPTPLASTAVPVLPTATAPAMAVTVNGQGITVAEYTAELARYKSAQQALHKNVSEADAGKTVLEDLIAQVLLEQGAKAAGYEISDSALQSRLEALASQLGGTDKLLQWESTHGYSAASFRTDLKRSIDAAWMRDKITQAVPTTADQVHVQQILLYNANSAQNVLQQLQGGADFNSLAAQYDPNARGDLGWFPRGYLLDPQVEQAAFSLQVGQISNVIQTDVGYDIIKVLERDPQHPLSPDAYLAMQEQALQNWVAQHRAQAAIVLAPQ